MNGTKIFIPISLPATEAGANVILTTDYNPGSSPSLNRNVVVLGSCLQMKMLPEEAINAATKHGACSLVIEKGMAALQMERGEINFMIPVPSLYYLPYSFVTNHIDNVRLRGKFILIN